MYICLHYIRKLNVGQRITSTPKNRSENRLRFYSAQRQRKRKATSTMKDNNVCVSAHLTCYIYAHIHTCVHIYAASRQSITLRESMRMSDPRANFFL